MRHSIASFRFTFIAIAGILLIITFSSGCDDGSALRNTDWELESVGRDDVLLGTAVTIDFAADRFTGSAGCNAYSGLFQARRGTLRMARVESTDMVCSRSDGTPFQGLMEQEERYLDLLESAATYEVAGGRLTINDSAGTEILSYVSQSSVAEVPDDERAIELDEPEFVEMLAPIVNARIGKVDADPPQYFLIVESGLPNNCARFDRYQVNREDQTIRVSIFNQEPQGAVCEEQYSTVEQSIPLGSDFEPDTTYTAYINEAVLTFVTKSSESITGTPAQLTPTTNIEAVPTEQVTSSPTASASPTPTVPATPTSTDQPTPVPTVTATNSPTPTGTAPATATATIIEACAIPSGWYEHTIAQGENLFRIAQGSGIIWEELSELNCLDNPRRIVVGETIFIPKPISPEDSPPAESVKSYVILPADDGRAGPVVACDDSIVSVWRDQTVTGSLDDDLTAALEQLFTLDAADYRPLGYVHPLQDAQVTVQDVRVTGDSAVVELTGTFPLRGDCSDARREAQILYTVFQFSGINAVLLHVNDQNLKALLSSSDTVGEDEPYRRSNQLP